MKVLCETLDAPVWRIRLTAGDSAQIVLSAGGVTDLLKLVAQAEQSETCRLLVLEGSDGDFCRGMDLDDLVARPAIHATAGVELYATCVWALRASSRPVVALVDGAALAGGLGLVAAADIVIATERATFGLPELVVGLVPSMVLPLLMERMPPQKARHLALSGSAIDAREAQALGLVDQVVASGADLEPTLRPIARNLLRARPAAVAQLKALTADIAHQPLRDGLAAGADLTAKLLAQPENIEAIRRFLTEGTLPWAVRLTPSGGAATEPVDR